MNRINHLFNRLLDNSISETELEELLDELDHPDSEDQMKEAMDEHWDLVREMIGPAQLDARTKAKFGAIVKNTGLQKNPQASKTSKINNTQNIIRWIGVAASLVILISAGFYWFSRVDTASDITPVVELATTQYTGKQVVNLPDGSTVILNEGSQLSFHSESFGLDKREIRFSGEGYFDIAHDPVHPFQVHTGQVTTTVLGTAFNLMAYEDQPQISVTVERGEVAVGDENRVYDKIHPQEQLTVNKRTKKFEKEEADMKKILAWKEKFLILTETTIEKAAAIIGARYHMQVKIANEEVRNCTINAAFMQGESIEQVLRVICGVLQAEYNIIDNTVEIIGGRKCE